MVHGQELCMFSWVSVLKREFLSDSEHKNVLTTDQRAHFNMHSLEWAAAALPRRLLCQLVSHPQDPHTDPSSDVVSETTVALLLHFIAVTLLLPAPNAASLSFLPCLHLCFSFSSSPPSIPSLLPSQHIHTPLPFPITPAFLPLCLSPSFYPGGGGALPLPFPR